MAGGCIFVFFSLLAIQGLLLNLLPGRWFLRVSLFVQAVLFIATVGALPLCRPPTGDRRMVAAGMVRAPLGGQGQRQSLRCAGGARHRTAGPDRRRGVPAQLPPLPQAAARGPARYGGGHSAGVGSRLLEWWIPNPREQAAFAFTWKTLARSRIHRLILLAYAGLALGWVIKAALDAPPVSLHDEGMYGLMSVASPLGLAVLMLLALRYLFCLPVTLPANWLFQTADAEGREAWLAAVQRFVIACGIAPRLPRQPAGHRCHPGLGARPGRHRARRDGGSALLRALLPRLVQATFHLLVHAGKAGRLDAASAIVAGDDLLRRDPAGPAHASGEVAAFLALFTALVLLWRRWRGKRQAEWAQNTLLWEEAPVTDVMALHLRPAERDAAMTAAPAREVEMFSSGMVRHAASSRSVGGRDRGGRPQ
jgi:hypothetical protein